ncbi:protein IQ-DOMAIN 2-like [Typha latifolia]|uniref:protein IQ-DOMAIN 2-like n=1 Tax=Typha latifolia TaxID=4733 RepID=UPI003C2D6940
MGRKGKWLVAVKKILGHESKEKRIRSKSKKKWRFGKSKHSDPVPLEPSVVPDVTQPSPSPPPPPPSPPPPPPPPSSSPPPPPSPLHEEDKEIKLSEIENEQSQHAYSVALASAVAAEAAAVAAQAAAEFVQLTAAARSPGKSSEEIAAIKIQTAFRGYQARRALRALRGLFRLKSLVDGNSVRRQTTNTLHCMQSLARVQSQIRSRRIRMSEENQSLQRQLQLKREKEIEKSKIGENWDDSLQSKEQIEASLHNKHEATIRRERALAYAFSHQWKSSSRTVTPMFTDPHNPQWGWSWSDRWMAARPWESNTTTEKEKDTNDNASVTSAARNESREIIKGYARRDTISEQTSPTPQKPIRSPSKVPSIAPSTPPAKLPSTAGKTSSVSSKSGLYHSEDDTGSVLSMRSERSRRHSIAGSLVKDVENLTSSQVFPSYMQSTKSAMARSRHQSPLTDKAETPDKGSTNTAKKRLSFPVADKPSMPSPGRIRRHSGPPIIEVAPLKDDSIPVEQITSNEESR